MDSKRQGRGHWLQFFKKAYLREKKAYLISWCNFLFAKWKKAQCAPKELQKVKLKVFLAVEAGLRERSCSGDLRGCGWGGPTAEANSFTGEADTSPEGGGGWTLG